MNKTYTIPKIKLEDEHKTGFYSYKNDEFQHFRLQDSHLQLDGIIRLKPPENKDDEAVFEGFNGAKWVQFNALKGETGDKGADFHNQFKFVNCLEEQDSSKKTNNKGFIFKTNQLDTNKSTNINIRCLQGSKTMINDKEVPTMKIITNESTISLQSLPQPFKWNISKLSLNDMKSKGSDNVFKCYGRTVISDVNSSISIKKGQFVSLVTQEEKIELQPFQYEDNLDLFLNPVSVFGVALEDSADKNKIKVCVEGITTVKYCPDLNDIEDNMMGIPSIDKQQSYGILSRKGFVFYSPIRPSVDYIKVGTFLEEGECDYVLFNVKI